MTTKVTRTAATTTCAPHSSTSWQSYSLLRDTGGILLDQTPDAALAEKVRKTIEAEGDELTDLHLWRLGPGHLGAIVSLVTRHGREPDFYRKRLAGLGPLSHVTVEVSSGSS